MHYQTYKKANIMNQNCDSCPFENTQCGQFCSLLSTYNQSNIDYECKYHFECTQIRDLLVRENKIAVIL
jgi:hypothetical protein